MTKLRKTLRCFAAIVLCLSMLLAASALYSRNHVRAADSSYYQVTFQDSMPAAEVLAKGDASGLHVLRVWTAWGDAQGCITIPDDIKGAQAVQQYVTNHMTDLLQGTTTSLQHSAAVIDDPATKASVNHSIENGKEVLETIGRGGLAIIAIDVDSEGATDIQRIFEGARSSRIPRGGIIPSPQLTDTLTNEATTSTPTEQTPGPASITTYDPTAYPDDSTWLPSWGQVNVYPLASGNRCVDQGVYWNSNARMSFFHDHWNSNYEQDTVFWDGQYVSQVAWTVQNWISNFPSWYADTRLCDDPPVVNVGVGCGLARDLQVNTYYYYELELLPGTASQSYELQVDEQPGHFYGVVGGAFDTFSYKTHIEFIRRWVPAYYSWSY